MSKVKGSQQHDPCEANGFGAVTNPVGGYDPWPSDGGDWLNGSVETTGPDATIIKSVDLGGTPARNTTLGGAETQNDKPEPNSETWGIGLGADTDNPSGHSYRHINRKG